MMTFEKFATLVDELKRHLVVLDLSMWGDPLIVPAIYGMIRHAHDARIWTYSVPIFTRSNRIATPTP